jgi:hypothetical protein
MNEKGMEGKQICKLSFHSDEPELHANRVK